MSAKTKEKKAEKTDLEKLIARRKEVIADLIRLRKERNKLTDVILQLEAVAASADDPEYAAKKAAEILNPKKDDQ